MTARASRILALLLAVALHGAILAPAWLGSDTLRGGIGGRPEGGMEMVVSLAQAPPEPATPETAKTRTPPDSQALKTEREPAPAEPTLSREEVPETSPRTEPEESKALVDEEQEVRERQRRAGDGRVAGAGAHDSGADDDAWNRYLGTLQREIERHKTYPRQARLRRQQGEVRVRFRLDSEGRTRSVTVVGSAGSDILDGHVRELLRRLRFPAPPEGVDIHERVITLPVRFRLDG